MVVLEKQLSDACPDGVDVYFENVGGRVLDAVIPLLNRGVRIAISGYISLYNEDRTTRAPTPIDVKRTENAGAVYDSLEFAFAEAGLDPRERRGLHEVGLVQHHHVGALHLRHII